MRRLFALFLLAVATSTSALTQPNEKTAAESTAATFLRGLDNGDLGSLYQNMVASRSKTQVPSDLFGQTIGYWRIQKGGAASSRTLVGSEALTFLPAMNLQGNFYYVRFEFS